MPRVAVRARRGRYGNPVDVERMVRRQLAPERPRWQKPDAVVRALGLGRGAVVADIGSGPGFFTLRLARAVGPEGHVYAVDPEPLVLDRLRERLGAAGVTNVTPVLGQAGDPMLPPGCCDLALIVNTYHHIADGPAFLRRVVRVLRPGGRVADIDWDAREMALGPPIGHRVARAAFLADAGRAGLALETEHRFLPHQYFLVLRPARRRTAGRRPAVQ
jgi:SAM-dependent methyltransferase